MSDLELLKRYLQNEIDTGGHKIFVFDKDYNAIEFKTIEALNEINNLQKQLQEKENIIKEVREYIKENITYYYDEDLDEGIYQDEISGDKVLEILDKEVNND